MRKKKENVCMCVFECECKCVCVCVTCVYMCVFISLMMRRRIMSTFIAHDSINVNARCAERCVCVGGGGGSPGGGKWKVIKKKYLKTQCVQSHSYNRCMHVQHILIWQHVANKQTTQFNETIDQ